MAKEMSKKEQSKKVLEVRQKLANKKKGKAQEAKDVDKNLGDEDFNVNFKTRGPVSADEDEAAKAKDAEAEDAETEDGAEAKTDDTAEAKDAEADKNGSSDDSMNAKKAEATDAPKKAEAADAAEVDVAEQKPAAATFVCGRPGVAYEYWLWTERRWVMTTDVFAAKQAGGGTYEVVWVWITDDGKIHHRLDPDEIFFYAPTSY